MPEISRFLGIVVAMYYREHQPPHFHAKYGGQTAAFSIADLRLIEGATPAHHQPGAGVGIRAPE